MSGFIYLPLKASWSKPELGAWPGSPGKRKDLKHSEAKDNEPDGGVRGEQGRLNELAPQDNPQHSARHYRQKRQPLHIVQMTSLSCTFSMHSLLSC